MQFPVGRSKHWTLDWNMDWTMDWTTDWSIIYTQIIAHTCNLFTVYIFFK